MGTPILVLDHGYVEFIEAWGGGRNGGDEQEHEGGITSFELDYEVGIIEAARQSTQGSFRGWETDAKLLKYLYEHKHSTPFEFAGMVIEVQAPIFVFREWHRHRTQSYNEMSARYAPLPDLYYVPDAENLLQRGNATLSSNNRQAVGAGRFDGQYATLWMEDIKLFYTTAERLYQSALSAGIPKELARITMPVGHYSRMRAAANLRNWLAFMTLRLDPAAQWEIRQYAEAVATIIRYTFPQTGKLFDDSRA